jgi:hypothetical protein
MWKFLNKLGWGPLIFAAVLLGLAPFRPEPHLVEKLRMLVQGTLRKPIDILDLLFHLAPLILIVLKLFAREK